MAFFTKDFTESLATRDAAPTGSLFARPVAIGETLPNPYRFSILSEMPLVGWQTFFTKADGSSTKRISVGDYPSKELLAAYEAQIGPGTTVAFEKDFETQKLTDRPAIKRAAAFFIWDYDAKAVKVLEYTQKILLGEIARKTADPDYEDLTAWDIEISKLTVNTKVSYSVNMKPALRARDAAIEAELQAGWQQALAAGADLNRLVDGGNPFSAN